MSLVRTMVSTWTNPSAEMRANWAVAFALFANLLLAAVWLTASIAFMGEDYFFGVISACLLMIVWLATAFETVVIGLGALMHSSEVTKPVILISKVGASILLSLVPLIWMIWLAVVSAGNME